MKFTRKTILMAIIVIALCISSSVLIVNSSFSSTQGNIAMASSVNNSDMIYFLQNRLIALEDLKASIDESQIEKLDKINEEINIIKEKIAYLYNAIIISPYCPYYPYYPYYPYIPVRGSILMNRLSLYFSIAVLAFGLFTIGGLELWKYYNKKRTKIKN